MKRTLVIGDIHGGFRALPQVLKLADVTEEDTLIFLGDLVDGWSGAFEVIDFLRDLEQKQECIFVKGNHDLYCEHWLSTGETYPNWHMHGGEVTQNAYFGKTQEEKEAHLAFYQKMVLHHVDQKNRLFIHAGFTSQSGLESERSQMSFMWDRTLLEATIAMDERLDSNSIRYPKRLKLFNEIFIGHTPTQKYNFETPIHAGNLWDMDTGAAFKGSLTIMDVDTKEFWQSEPVYLLYPEEMGRNKG